VPNQGLWLDRSAQLPISRLLARDDFRLTSQNNLLGCRGNAHRTWPQMPAFIKVHGNTSKPWEERRSMDILDRKQLQ
jgi:hypothetical protein